MKTKYAVLAGLDWADQKHDLCIMETATGEKEHLVLAHQPECINEWVSKMMNKYPGQRIAICLEQSRGPVVYALMGYSAIDLYPINPACLASYRKSFHNSGAKDDLRDAALLLDRLERHPETLKVWRPDRKETRLLAGLCRDRRKAVDMRTGLCNELRSTLKNYYPQALALAGESLYSKMAYAFLKRWPSFQALARSQAESIRRFYRAQNSRSEAKIEERLQLIATSRPLTDDDVVLEVSCIKVEQLIAQIRVLNHSIEIYEQKIQETFEKHPDAFIFQSFPGSGRQQAPRLLAAFGDDRNHYTEASGIAAFAGVAPVIQCSGKQSWTHWRWHAPCFVRQSFVEFAGSSVVWSRWAKIYYDKQRERGKQHHVAVRALAFKWMRILFRCWQDRVPYNEEIYLAALEKRGSWIAEAMKKVA